MCRGCRLSRVDDTKVKCVGREQATEARQGHRGTHRVFGNVGQQDSDGAGFRRMQGAREVEAELAQSAAQLQHVARHAVVAREVQHDSGNAGCDVGRVGDLEWNLSPTPQKVDMGTGL